MKLVINRGKQITNVMCVPEGSWVSGLGIFIEIGYDAHATANPCPCEAEIPTNHLFITGLFFLVHFFIIMGSTPVYSWML